jgi:hypothetical protein
MFIQEVFYFTELFDALTQLLLGTGPLQTILCVYDITIHYLLASSGKNWFRTDIST